MQTRKRDLPGFIINSSSNADTSDSTYAQALYDGDRALDGDVCNIGRRGEKAVGTVSNLDDAATDGGPLKLRIAHGQQPLANRIF